MKRSQMYKRGSRRKNSIFNHIDRNVVYPTLFFNPVVFNEEDIGTGVEIIEINSDEEPIPVKCKNSKSACTKYSLQDNYTIHEENETIGTNHNKGYENYNYTYNDYAFDKACTDFYGIDCSGDRTYSKEFLNKFYHLNKNSNISEQVSDTSSSDINVTQSETSLSDSYDSHKAYGKKAEITSNGFEINMTYALKSDPNEDLLDSTSTEDEFVKDFNTIRRVATPAPNYMPRLILPSSPTLPTVTEVNEPNKPLIKITKTNSKNPFQKSNGWFDNDKNLEIERQPNDEKEQRLSTLSERENRRKRLKEIQETLDRQKIPTNSQNKIKVIIQNLINPKINKNDNDTISVEEFADIKPEQKITNEMNPELKIDLLNCDEKNFSDTIEKLEGNWINNDSKNEIDTTLEIFDCDLNDSRAVEVFDDTKEKVSERMTPLDGKCLKVSGNVPSLQLSFVTDEDRKSWFKRLLQWIQCCK